MKGARLGDVAAPFMPSPALAVRGTKSLRATFNGATMAKFLVPLANGIYTSDSVQTIGLHNEDFYHQMAFSINGSPTTGTIEIKAKAPDSDVYESVPDGVISLTAPETLTFQFMAESYQFTIAGSDVSTGHVSVSDRELKGA